MLDVKKTVKSIQIKNEADALEHLLASEEPAILKGFISSWPAVQAAKASHEDIQHYLLQFYQGNEILGFVGPPENQGRIFYNESFNEFNYQRYLFKLNDALKKMDDFNSEVEPSTLYIGSSSVDHYLPGFRTQNDLALNNLHPMVSIWLCNRSRISAHWDSPANIACCVSGKRRFTLFPFSQIENLYVGPLDRTPAGQAISLVDFYSPDFNKYPKFEKALEHAQIAELEPGDALFIPSMWWHHVESLGSLNILVNYWMNEQHQSYGNAMDAMFHAILSIRELPQHQREAWKKMFDHYVFDFNPEEIEHIPEHARGILGESNSDWARRIRAYLISHLNK